MTKLLAEGTQGMNRHYADEDTNPSQRFETRLDGENNPRACSDSEEPRASVVDSTAGMPRLAAWELADAGSSPARDGSEGTPSVTAGATPAVGTERFLVFLRAGAQVWASGLDHATAEDALDHVRFIERSQPSGFADGYRIKRLVVTGPGSFQSLVCLGEPREVEP